MNKNRFYLSVIAALLLSNLLLAGFLFFSPTDKKRMDHEGPKNIIIKKLNLDDQQIRQYELLIHAHRKLIDEKDREIMSLKNNLYALLPSSENNETIRDSLINKLGTVQREIESIHFSHFQEIKKLCLPEQLSAYDKLAEEISTLFFKPHPRPPHK